MVSLLTLPAVEGKEDGDHSAGRMRKRAGALSRVFSSAGLPLNSFHLLLAQKECSSNCEETACLVLAYEAKLDDKEPRSSTLTWS